MASDQTDAQHNSAPTINLFAPPDPSSPENTLSIRASMPPPATIPSRQRTHPPPSAASTLRAPPSTSSAVGASMRRQAPQQPPLRSVWDDDIVNVNANTNNKTSSSSSSAARNSGTFLSANSPQVSSSSSSSDNSRPRAKIALKPGHSPLDWAALQRHPPSETFLRGEGVPVDRHLRVTPSILAAHNGRRRPRPRERSDGEGTPTNNSNDDGRETNNNNDAWAVFGPSNAVYNISPYLDFHPGGRGKLLMAAGKSGAEAKRLFDEVHPWVNWEGILEGCCVGFMVPEGEGEGEGEGMESMD